MKLQTLINKAAEAFKNKDLCYVRAEKLKSRLLAIHGVTSVAARLLNESSELAALRAAETQTEKLINKLRKNKEFLIVKGESYKDVVLKLAKEQE